MNYRHAYHAGNFADVFKHALLVHLIAALRKKPTPIRVIDAHAGIGLYDLTAIEATKTGEYRFGIGRLWDSPLSDRLSFYVSAVRDANRLSHDGTLRYYPGSPRLIRSLLRDGDRLDLVELHPEDARQLASSFSRDSQVRIHAMDAYTALKALTPPAERRGLVLIDPPFEQGDEFGRVAHGLTQALKRWASGVYAIWYPIKTRPPVDTFFEHIRAMKTEALICEILIAQPDSPSRLSGCGVLILNPPWKIDETAQTLGREILTLLGHDPSGASVRWLVDEKGISP